MTFSEMLTQSGRTRNPANWVSDIGTDRVTFLLVMMLAYILLGMFMDSLGMILATVPLLLPILHDLDISLLWFGVFVVLMAEFGLLTPPVGILSFVLHGVVQDPQVNLGHRIDLKEVFAAALALIPGVVVLVLILIFVPDLVTLIPDMMANQAAP